MRKTIMGCLGVVAMVVAAQFALAEVKAGECYTGCDPCAEASCDPCESICDLTSCDPCGPNLFGCGPRKSKWNWGGHMEAGFFANEYGRTNSYWPGGMGPTWESGNTALLKNVHNSDAQMNQLYLFLERTLNTRRGWDVGGRVDFMYGTDARFVQSRGLEYGSGHGGAIHEGRWNSGDYYSALPQMYVEVGYKNLSVKAGKFLMPMGHDSVLSTGRFFYSLSDAFGIAPVTQSGLLASWDAGKRLTVFGGWTNGATDDGEDLFFDTGDSNAFLGGFNFAVNKRLSLGYSVLMGRERLHYNNDPIQGITSADRDYFIQSFIVGFKPNKRWDYTFEWTLRNDIDKVTTPGSYDKYYDGAYGINNELVYTLNKKWSFGARAEWIHVYSDGYSENKYSFSLGANWNPRTWLTIRPELRYDKFEHETPFAEKGAAGRDRDKQLAGGVSAIVKF